MNRFCQLLLIASFSIFANAQGNRIDTVRHDAPELANFGELNIGVRTMTVIDQNRPDILNTRSGEATAYYDRSLTVEIWYPAQLQEGQQPGGQYTSTTRNTAVKATLYGKAVREANILATAIPYPLVIISHGYPGNRYLLSHLGENLASKGYVVVSIDHTDSTYEDQQAFSSTLYNRALDQRFVLNQIDTMNGDSSSFLAGSLNTSLTAVVGFSMGGYGLMNNLGGGYNTDVAALPIAPPNKMLLQHTFDNPDFKKTSTPELKRVWRSPPGVWLRACGKRMTYVESLPQPFMLPEA